MVQFKKSERDCGTRQRGTHPAGAECPSPDEGSVFSFRGYGWGGAGGGRSRVSARDISKSDIQIHPGTNPLPSKEKWLI